MSIDLQILLEFAAPHTGTSDALLLARSLSFSLAPRRRSRAWTPPRFTRPLSVPRSWPPGPPHAPSICSLITTNVSCLSFNARARGSDPRASRSRPSGSLGRFGSLTPCAKLASAFISALIELCRSSAPPSTSQVAEAISMPGSTWSNTFITTQSIVFMLRSFVFTESLPIALAIRPFSITILLLCFSKSVPVSSAIRFVGFTPCLV
mmetsp:Transcript_133355/g.426569  ORF Transcript_133355/g.426569 Transcript_133355/m.426569 type:complete len:207 (-) Transcript_133355:201-821(-)